ncbi:unnamed protein product [Adineta ricciae]|nr:unnamed protein product [Adineta ricciae]
MNKDNVTIQPTARYHLKNTFDCVDGEEIIRVYECRQGCSGFCGPKTAVTLTKNRLITRDKEAGGCCTKGAHVDTSIYLNDIGMIAEASDTKYTFGCAAFLAIITCMWPFLLLGYLLRTCCCCRSKLLEVSGAFGSKILTFKNKLDLKDAAMNISKAMMPYKAYGSTARHPVSQIF